MPIDPSVAVGAELPAQEFEWSSTDVQLYNLGIGAGSHPTDAGELRMRLAVAIGREEAGEGCHQVHQREDDEPEHRELVLPELAPGELADRQHLGAAGVGGIGGGRERAGGDELSHSAPADRARRG